MGGSEERIMKHSSIAFLLFATVSFYAVPAHAFDLNGAWATSPDACANVFAKTETAITFAKDSDMYGSGFIVDASEIRGPRARCSIKARKQDATLTHLLAICSTEIMIDQTQLSYQVLDDNRILRVFPGMENLGTAFSRCSFK
jgi:hypothetical protein